MNLQDDFVTSFLARVRSEKRYALASRTRAKAQGLRAFSEGVVLAIQLEVGKTFAPKSDDRKQASGEFLLGFEAGQSIAADLIMHFKPEIQRFVESLCTSQNEPAPDPNDLGLKCEG